MSKTQFSWANILVTIFSIGILISSIVLLNKINKCKKTSSTSDKLSSMRVKGVDVYVNPSDLDGPKPSQTIIDQCNQALQSNQGQYFCYDGNSTRLIDPTDVNSGDTCDGGIVAIVPDNFGGSNCPPYRGSCSRPIKSEYSSVASGDSLKGSLCTTLGINQDIENTYPIAENNCGGGDMKTKGKPCSINANYDFPPCVGFCS